MVDVDVRYALGRPVGSGPLKVHCPFHDDTAASMAVYPNGSWCFVCNRGETADAFLTRLGHSGYALPAAPSQTTNVGVEKHVQLVTRQRLRVTVWAAHQTLFDIRHPRQRWLLERGIWPQTIAQQQIGHTGEKFVIPIWDAGDVVGVKYRSDPAYCDPDEPKYQSPRGQPSLIYRPNKGGSPLVICEGELDALLLTQLGCDAITTTAGAGSLHKDLRQLPARGPIYIATDQDDAGETAARQLTTLFPTARRMRWEIDNDVTDALKGSLNKSRDLQRWVETAERL